ncbi:apolipoprotein N-acyltransferase [Rickettsiales bacterium]|nr:apolipoprotein N-acyltransferase [Rickettsiales bacterium]
MNKKNYFISFFLGALSSLAFAPTYFIILSIIGFSGLILFLNKAQNNKESFILGFSFGFGHFIIGLYWISISLFVDIAKFGWLLPFSITLIPAACAVYIGLVALISRKLAINLGNFIDYLEDIILKSKKLTKKSQKSSNSINLIIIFAIIWVFFEYLRSILFSGFPWNLIGYQAVFSINFSQIASIIGIYGLSFLIILFATIPAIFFEICDNKLKFCKFSAQNLIIFLSSLIIFLSIFLWGASRINSTQLDLVENGNVRIIQPNIEQNMKWDPEYKYNSFIKNIHLTNSYDKDDINYVIWSESSIPYLVGNNSQQLLNLIRRAVPRGGFVISGALRAEYKNSNINKIFNSIIAVNEDGEIVDFYDKTHLVPFGEYIPLQEYLPFITKITNGAMSFSAGSELKIMKMANNLPKFNPLICYEVIFSDLARAAAQDSDFMVNLTNDAWFGKSSGPYQHLAMARIRSIETGLSLVRAANTGISAYIDPMGRIIDYIKLNEEGFIDVQLIKKFDPTFYLKYGDAIIIYLFFILILVKICIILIHIFYKKLKIVSK